MATDAKLLSTFVTKMIQKNWQASSAKNTTFKGTISSVSNMFCFYANLIIYQDLQFHYFRLQARETSLHVFTNQERKANAHQHKFFQGPFHNAMQIRSCISNPWHGLSHGPHGSNLLANVSSRVRVACLFTKHCCTVRLCCISVVAPSFFCKKNLFRWSLFLI